MDNSLGDRIRSMRSARGLTQQAAADRAGIAAQAWRSYEYGARRPSYEVLEAIADALDCTMAELLGEESPREAARRIVKHDDDEVWALREALKSNPELHTMLSLGRKATPEQLRQGVRVLQALWGDDRDD